ncbi:hypothetical protein PanWU01x14_185430 [Parasponia andersonii]|uniref:Uncharacterized protein n=1 Tax=Parasponia andersonii TaxID=3476 RepID=A0A2P5C4B6_PARAD|nr:hypothetical protein PanWU01x14_185430 [Parasponia andersonii]
MNGNRKVCKFEATLRSMQEKKNSGASESAGHSSSNAMWGIARIFGVSIPKRINIDDKRRKERAENLVQLICWGPN